MRLRTKPDLTQNDLARKAEVSYQTLLKVRNYAVNKPGDQAKMKIS